MPRAADLVAATTLGGGSAAADAPAPLLLIGRSSRFARVPASSIVPSADPTTSAANFGTVSAEGAAIVSGCSSIGVKQSGSAARRYAADGPSARSSARPEAGRTVETAARRELLEETGYTLTGIRDTSFGQAIFIDPWKSNESDLWYVAEVDMSLEANKHPKQA